MSARDIAAELPALPTVRTADPRFPRLPCIYRRNVWCVVEVANPRTGALHSRGAA